MAEVLWENKRLLFEFTYIDGGKINQNVFDTKLNSTIQDNTVAVMIPCYMIHVIYTAGTPDRVVIKFHIDVVHLSEFEIRCLDP